MTLSLYIWCTVMYILGQAVQLFLIKIPGIKKQAKIANASFVWKDWWTEDWQAVIGTTLFGAMLIIGLNEIVQWKPSILEYVKWFFAFIGMGGSNYILSKWSSYSKYFDGVIDGKTNIADGITDNTKKP